MQTTVKTVELSHFLNPEKEERLKEVIREQSSYLLENTIWLIDELETKGKMPQRRSSKTFPQTKLPTTSYSDAFNQAKAAMNSWLGSAVRHGRDMITSLGLDEKDPLRHALYSINTSKLWLDPRISKAKAWTSLTKEQKLFAEDLLEDIFETIKSINPYPLLGMKPTIWTRNSGGGLKSNDLSRLKRNKRLKKTGEIVTDGEFDYWVSISSFTPRKMISIPLKTNRYFESLPGDIQRTVTLTIDEEINRIRVFVGKKSTVEQAHEDLSGSIAIDWGLRSVFATSEGELLGTKLWDYLQKQDVKLQDLTAKLNRLGVKLRSSSRYNRLVRRIRETVKSEVNRLLNKISDRGYAEIIVENLDFRGKKAGLSKRMRRLLSSAGRGEVSKKLKSIEAEMGVKIVDMNPAYSSQECHSCRYVDRKNRNGERFQCVKCGAKIHADVGGAIVLKARSSRGEQWSRLSVDQVREKLRIAHEEFLINSRQGKLDASRTSNRNIRADDSLDSISSSRKDVIKCQEKSETTTVEHNSMV